MLQMKKISEFINAIKAQSGKKALSKALSVSVLNQVVSSGTNFAIVIYLVRIMDKSDFGLYSLGFALMLLLSGFITSSIADQFVVNLPDQSKEKRAAYALHHSFAVFFLGLLLILFGAVAGSTPWILSIEDVNMREIFFPAVVAAGLYAQRDLLMRVAYAERRESVVLLSTLAVTAGIATTFMFYWLTNQQIIASDALIALSIGQGAGWLSGMLQLQLPFRELNLKNIYHAFRDSWVGGRWSVLTNVVYNIRSQAHNFVIGPILGLPALAEVNAARILVTPAIMAIPPLTQVLISRLADKRAQGMVVLLHFALLAIGALAISALVYAAFLMVLMPWILPLVLGESYQHVGSQVLAWCVVAIILAARNGQTMVLQVIRAFRQLLFANLISAVIAVILSIVFANLLGGLGVVIAIAISEFLLCTILLKLLLRRLKAIADSLEIKAK